MKCKRLDWHALHVLGIKLDTFHNDLSQALDQEGKTELANDLRNAIRAIDKLRSTVRVERDTFDEEREGS